MSVTRLERKGRKNKNVAKNRISVIKRLSAFPVIKNIDLEELKADVKKREAEAGKTSKPTDEKQKKNVETPVKSIDAKKAVAKTPTKKDEIIPKKATPKKEITAEKKVVSKKKDTPKPKKIVPKTEEK